MLREAVSCELTREIGFECNSPAIDLVRNPLPCLDCFSIRPDGVVGDERFGLAARVQIAHGDPRGRHGLAHLFTQSIRYEFQLCIRHWKHNFVRLRGSMST